MNRILVFGIGNEYRSDDGAGIEAARTIDARGLPNVLVEWNRRDALYLIEFWKKSSHVIAIDAVFVSGDTQAGRIHRFEVHRAPVPSKFKSTSTHAFGLSEAIELARGLKQLPTEFVVYGIEGADFSEKKGLSEPVRKAVSEVEGCILRDIELWNRAAEGVSP